MATVFTGCSNKLKNLYAGKESNTTDIAASKEEEQQENQVNMRTKTGYNQPISGANQVNTVSDGSYNQIVKVDADNSSITAMDAITGDYIAFDSKYQNVLTVQFKYYNGSDESQCWIAPWNIQAFQNGIELETNTDFEFSVVCEEYGYDDEMLTSVMPRANLLFNISYNLRDANAPVIIQVTSNSTLFSKNKDIMQVEYDLSKIRQYYAQKIEEARKEEEKQQQKQQQEQQSGSLIQNQQQALEYLKQYLRNSGEYIPQYIEFDSVVDQGYCFQGYDDMGDHISTSFWYAVSEDGRIYDTLSGEYVDERNNQYDSSGDYILPYSDSEYYSYDEISQLTSETLRLARNEIFARYGYVFQDEGLKEYFENCSWYTPTGMSSEEIESILNDYERENLNVIKQCENE